MPSPFVGSREAQHGYEPLLGDIATKYNHSARQVVFQCNTTQDTPPESLFVNAGVRPANYGQLSGTCKRYREKIRYRFNYKAILSALAN